jgi:hypothetical protein
MIPFGVMTVIVVVLSVGVWCLNCKVDFYRAYYRQKQRNLGKNPDDGLKEMFGWWWWLMR